MDDNDGLAVETLSIRNEPRVGPESGRSGREPFEAADRVVDRSQLERCRIDLLSARDALVGSQAEKAAAQGRVQDLDLQVYMLTLERDDLRAENDRLRQRLGRRGPTGRLRSVAKGAVRRLRGG